MGECLRAMGYYSKDPWYLFSGRSNAVILCKRCFVRLVLNILYCFCIVYPVINCLEVTSVGEKRNDFLLLAGTR